jgi:hypothetical protein
LRQLLTRLEFAHFNDIQLTPAVVTNVFFQHPSYFGKRCSFNSLQLTESVQERLWSEFFISSDDGHQTDTATDVLSVSLLPPAQPLSFGLADALRAPQGLLRTAPNSSCKIFSCQNHSLTRFEEIAAQVANGSMTALEEMSDLIRSQTYSRLELFIPALSKILDASNIRHPDEMDRLASSPRRIT